ncbi:hypothetical protein [Azonexus sp.]|jgi:hypothetical protein|uniref:hypothetical protein n=1 Tax=Azonexus sp. TaxID=1872668 RepID=UPI0028257750|nr:hypothetical protein [Azonexus sp.]MDR1995001.1 hypothetical protein [Azonexus sp.]
MELLTALLVVGIALRVILDLSTLKFRRPLFDWLYTGLFLIVGILMLFRDQADLFGCLSIGMAWGLVAFISLRRSG